MIILDNPDIKNCEFGICTVLNDDGSKYRMRVFKTIDSYLLFFGFGKGYKGAAFTLSELRGYKKESEKETVWTFTEES